MAAAHGTDAIEMVSDAVERGLDASAVQDLLQRVGLPQERTDERKRALVVLRKAASRESEVFEVVLDALSKQTIWPNDWDEKSPLLFAVRNGNARMVMAVVERMRKEGMKHGGWLFKAFFRSGPSIFGDDEVAGGVMSVMSTAAYDTASSYGDCIYDALRYCAPEDRKRGIELCLKYGPSMEERLSGPLSAESRRPVNPYPPRLRYVGHAAERGSSDMALMMHDMVPLLPDGSGRRAEVADYVRAINLASGGYSADGAETGPIIMGYLVEQAGGVEVLDQCDPLLCFRTVGLLEWVAEHAPHLVEKACQQPGAINLLIHGEDVRFLEYATAKILELVDRKVIAAMMRQATRFGGLRQAGGWRWQMEKLHKAVPESMDGLEWAWLMDSIWEGAYKDVEYMVAMCKREHLVTRNEDGDTAHDVAAKDEEFPQELLLRLNVAAKGAHA